MPFFSVLHRPAHIPAQKPFSAMQFPKSAIIMGLVKKGIEKPR
jgi:hypothetical protein